MLKNYIFILISLFTLSACTKTTFVRRSPDFFHHLANAKVGMILPPEVEVVKVDAGNKKHRLYDIEDNIEDILSQQIKEKMLLKGYNVKLLSKREIALQKVSREVLDTKEECQEVLASLYKGGAWPEEKAYNIDRAAPAAARLAPYFNSNLLIYLTFYTESKTTGALVKDFASDVLLGALAGRNHYHVNTPKAASILRILIIDSITGKVLWSHSASPDYSPISISIDTTSPLRNIDSKRLEAILDITLSELPPIK